MCARERSGGYAPGCLREGLVEPDVWQAAAGVQRRAQPRLIVAQDAVRDKGLAGPQCYS